MLITIANHNQKQLAGLLNLEKVRVSFEGVAQKTIKKSLLIPFLNLVFLMNDFQVFLIQVYFQVGIISIEMF